MTDDWHYVGPAGPTAKADIFVRVDGSWQCVLSQKTVANA